MHNSDINFSGMKNVWERHRFAFLSAGLVFLISTAIYGVAWPLIFSIEKMVDDIQKKTIDNQLIETKGEKIAELEAEYKYVSSHKDSLEVIFDPKDKVGLIGKLEGLASQTGNEIALKVVDEEKNSAQGALAKGASKEKKDQEKSIKGQLKYDQYVTLEITTRGTYADFINFLHKLENTTNYINVISLKSSKIKEAEEANGVFSPRENLFDSRNQAASSPEIEPEKKKEDKETLESVITIVAYLKK